MSTSHAVPIARLLAPRDPAPDPGTDTTTSGNNTASQTAMPSHTGANQLEATPIDSESATKATQVPPVHQCEGLEFSRSNPLHNLTTRLNQATDDAHHAECLHAYDLGVAATIDGMTNFWLTKLNTRHVSNAEKRIFRREAQRLQTLLGDARADAQKSNIVLLKKLGLVDKLYEELTKATKREAARGQ